MIPELDLVSVAFCSCRRVSFWPVLMLCPRYYQHIIHLGLLLLLNVPLPASITIKGTPLDLKMSRDPVMIGIFLDTKPTAKNFISDGRNLLSVRRMIRSVRFINVSRPGFGALQPVLPSELLMKTFKSIHSSPLARTLLFSASRARVHQKVPVSCFTSEFAIFLIHRGSTYITFNGCSIVHVQIIDCQLNDVPDRLESHNQ